MDKKKAQTGYQLFVSERVPEMKEVYPTLTNSQRMKLVIAEWKDMKDSDFDLLFEYKDRAACGSGKYGFLARQFEYYKRGNQSIRISTDDEDRLTEEYDNRYDKAYEKAYGCLP